jgi:hypothetical protein
MPIFLLTPVKLQAPGWRLSRHRTPVQVEAANEQQARDRAAALYTKSSGLLQFPFSPWRTGLVSVQVLEAAREDVPFLDETLPRQSRASR